MAFLALLLDTLEGIRLARKVNPRVGFEFADHPFDEGVIPVITSEEVSPSVAITSKTPSPISRTEISKGASTEVINRDLLVLFLVQTVGQRGCGGLVDDSLDLEAGDLACSLGRTSLGIVEISRNGDHSLGDGSLQASPRRPL